MSSEQLVRTPTPINKPPLPPKPDNFPSFKPDTKPRKGIDRFSSVFERPDITEIKNKTSSVFNNINSSHKVLQTLNIQILDDFKRNYLCVDTPILLQAFVLFFSFNTQRSINNEFRMIEDKNELTYDLKVQLVKSIILNSIMLSSYAKVFYNVWMELRSQNIVSKALYGAIFLGLITNIITCTLALFGISIENMLVVFSVSSSIVMTIMALSLVLSLLKKI